MVSFRDGLPHKGSGIPYFFLTTFDPSAKDAMKDERSSFTVSECPLETCGKIDPENPNCARITLTGKVSYKISFYLILIFGLPHSLKKKKKKELYIYIYIYECQDYERLFCLSF